MKKLILFTILLVFYSSSYAVKIGNNPAPTPQTPEKEIPEPTTEKKGPEAIPEKKPEKPKGAPKPDSKKLR